MRSGPDGHRMSESEYRQYIEQMQKTRRRELEAESTDDSEIAEIAMRDGVVPTLTQEYRRVLLINILYRLQTIVTKVINLYLITIIIIHVILLPLNMQIIE